MSQTPNNDVSPTTDTISSDTLVDSALNDTMPLSQSADEISYPQGPEGENISPKIGLSHFSIVNILGKGGAGTVYQAKDLTLERYVAIKMLRLAGSTQQQLLDEAKTISKLNHPNIVTIYDVAREHNADFIVMEWIDGQPLNAIIPAKGLPLEKVLAYAHQMVDAISAAHNAGIIHRDLKPQNIMIDEIDNVKVLDFGIAALLKKAKALDSNHQHKKKPVEPEQTQETAPAGTPHYMSPEQISGGDIDQRSDLFSLGIVLYELLTGMKPFVGDNIKQISTAINQGNYAPLNQDKAIAPIIEKLLQTDPNNRYQNVQSLKQDLTKLSAKLARQSHWWHRQHWLSKVVMVLPIMSILAWSMKEIVFPPTTQELIQRQLADAKKIAILPFDNISGDPVLQIFSDGVAAMLGNDLADIGYHQGDGNTWVLPNNQIRRLDNPSVEALYNEYGVELVITGSIQHLGSTRRVILTLLNGIDGQQLKSTQLTIDAKRLFSAQSDIRTEVVKLLNWQIPNSLTEQFASQKPTLDGAYKHYLEGQGYLYRFDQKNNIANAINAFETAIKLDNKYADAYAGLAQAQLQQHIETKDVTLLSSLSLTIEQLQQVKPSHRLLSYLQGVLAMKRGDYAEAVSLFNQSIAQVSRFSMAHLNLAKAHQRLGQLSASEQTLLNAKQQMPNNNLVLTGVGVFYYNQADYLQAITYFEQLAQQAPNNHVAHLNISACYYLLGEIEQAIIAVKKALAIQPDALSYSNLGTYYFILEDYQQAVDAYQQMITLNDTHFVMWGNLADAYRFAGDDKYLNAFQQAAVLAEQAIELNPNNKEAIAMLAYYYANLENSERSQFYSKQITDDDAGEHQFFVAAAYARLGQKQAAITYVGYAIKNQYSVAEVANSPLLHSLQDEPSFLQLINRGVNQ